MLFNDMSVKKQFAVLGVIVSIIVLFTGSFGLFNFYQANKRHAGVQGLSKTLLQTVDTARSAQVHFKIQV